MSVIRLSNRVLVASLTVLLWIGLAEMAAAQQARGPQTGDPGDGAITVVVPEDRPPFAMVGPDGQDIGFDVDMANALCAAGGLRCTVRCVPWAQAMDMLQSGDATLMMGGITEGWERMEFWSAGMVSYYRAPNRYAAPPGRIITPGDRQSMIGLRIGVVRDTPQADALFVRHGRRADIQEFANARALIAALEADQVDAVHDDGLVLWHFTDQVAAEPFRLTGIDGRRPDDRSLLVRSGRADLIPTLEAALREVKRSGRYLEISETYFPFPVY